MVPLGREYSVLGWLAVVVGLVAIAVSLLYEPRTFTLAAPLAAAAFMALTQRWEQRRMREAPVAPPGLRPERRRDTLRLEARIQIPLLAAFVVLLVADPNWAHGFSLLAGIGLQRVIASRWVKRFEESRDVVLYRQRGLSWSVRYFVLPTTSPAASSRAAGHLRAEST